MYDLSMAYENGCYKESCDVWGFKHKEETRYEDAKFVNTGAFLCECKSHFSIVRYRSTLLVTECDDGIFHKKTLLTWP